MRFTSTQVVFLDLLRGLSAVAVLVGHVLSSLFMPIEDRPLIGNRYDIQTYAVLIFFILSGLLVAHSALSKGREYGFIDFLIDRLCRIFVCLIPALLFVVAVDFAFGLWGPGNGPGVFIANLLMLQGVRIDLALPTGFHFPAYGSDAPLWTVAVEWWLYIAFGAVLFLTRMSWRQRLVLLPMLPLAVLVTLVWGARETLAVAWFAAAASSVTLSSIDPAKARSFALPAFLLSFSMLAYNFRDLDRHTPFESLDPKFLMLTVATVLLAVVVARAYEFRTMTKLLRPVAGFLAAISYALYLTHHTVLVAFASVTAIDYDSMWLLFAICIGVAWAFTWAFDRHHKAIARLVKGRLAGIFPKRIEESPA